MTKSRKSDVWTTERGHYTDTEIDFDYSIHHRVNDNDYLSGTLGAALAECAVFQDKASFLYFCALLMSGKVLVDASLQDDGSIIPQRIFNPEVGTEKCLALFTNIREISACSKTTYLYIEFMWVYDWIKSHMNDIDIITFDLLTENRNAAFHVDRLVNAMENLLSLSRKYSKSTVIKLARDYSLAEHSPKKVQY